MKLLFKFMNEVHKMGSGICIYRQIANMITSNSPALVTLKVNRPRNMHCTKTIDW